ncbi:MAG: cytochrome c [Herminiimonas sp.]|nr:cytochrome c [Herminiimonas sp.]
MKRIVLFLIAAVVAIPALLLAVQLFHDPGADQVGVPAANPAEQIERGRYLSLAGNCMACHTIRSGAAYAGGRLISTPFGAMYSPNITPDMATGIGSWSANDFWRAMHNGKSKDGRFLYPTFPYPNYTKVTRSDADAMYAFLRTVTPVAQASREHALRFPYNQRLLLAGWRALYFEPATYRTDAKQSIDWNRGAYLVQGLGHCSACHTSRNALGATESDAELGGGLIPMLNWYAPSLTSDAEAGLGNWELKHINDLLKTGVSQRSAVFGPMAEVVGASLQHLSDADINAMSVYLKALPQTTGAVAAEPVYTAGQDSDDARKLGAALYEQHCVECHRADGRGLPPGYPPLAGNHAISTASAINPIRMVLNGGFPPSTGGNSRPYGMPPFGPQLSDVEVAAVVSHLRRSWGNTAGSVSPVEVARYRTVPID